MRSRLAPPVVAVLAVLAAEQPWWVDEIITINLVYRWSAWEIVTILPLHQPHLPTYYLGLELLGPVFMLWLSAVSAAAASGFTVLAADELHGDEMTSLTAGSLVALSPFVAAQGGWLRMYAPLTALMAMGLWLHLADDERARWPLLGACVLHPFAPLGLLWRAILKRTPRSVAELAAGSIPAAGLFALAVSEGAVNKATTGVGHAIEPSALHLLVTPLSTIVGAPHNKIEVVLILVATILVITAQIDRRITLWVVLPVLTITVVSHVVHPIFRVKYFGFLAPGIALLIADPKRGAWRNAVLGAAIGLLLAVSWALRANGGLVARRIFVGF